MIRLIFLNSILGHGWEVCPLKSRFPDQILRIFIRFVETSFLDKTFSKHKSILPIKLARFANIFSRQLSKSNKSVLF